MKRTLELIKAIKNVCKVHQSSTDKVSRIWKICEHEENKIIKEKLKKVFNHLDGKQEVKNANKKSKGRVSVGKKRENLPN